MAGKLYGFLTLNLEIDEDAYKSGLSYEMYLRALLMIKDKTIKSSRTMDLVELWEKQMEIKILV